MNDHSEKVIEFVEGCWNSDVRDLANPAVARTTLRTRGIEREVREFLLGVIRGNTVTPTEWQDLVNVQTWEVEDMQEDAKDFWDWLFDDEPLPPVGDGSGIVRPPQS
jgi:hypothetical protein